MPAWRPQTNTMRAMLPYLDIARPSHWFKNVFILPGILLAACFGEGVVLSRGVLLAFAAACLRVTNWKA